MNNFTNWKFALALVLTVAGGTSYMVNTHTTVHVAQDVDLPPCH